jgi:hypothetical protein
MTTQAVKLLDGGEMLDKMIPALEWIGHPCRYQRSNRAPRARGIDSSAQLRETLSPRC